jgi:hypothetical protein
VTTPYRSDLDALRERQTSLAGELAALRQRTTGLGELRARENELARELASLEQRIAEGGGGSKRALPLLDRVRVASPCTADWNEMLGDERVRFCLGCEKNVYNLSSLPREEAEALLQARLGTELCIRFYQRADGTILTQDCPVGVKKKQRRKLALAVAGAGAMAAAAAATLLRPTCRKGAEGGEVAVAGAMYVPTEPTAPVVPTVMGTAMPTAPVAPPEVPTTVHPEPKHTMGKPAVLGRR